MMIHTAHKSSAKKALLGYTIRAETCLFNPLLDLPEGWKGFSLFLDTLLNCSIAQFQLQKVSSSDLGETATG